MRLLLRMMFRACKSTPLQKYERQNTDWASKPLALVPDFVIEMISPRDRYNAVSKKVAAYLDTITGADVVPGFSVPLRQIFED